MWFCNKLDENGLKTITNVFVYIPNISNDQYVANNTIDVPYTVGTDLCECWNRFV